MRYTETKHENEMKDLLDVVRVLFTSILLSPFRLLSEISTKIMYLDRALIEKVLLSSIVLDTILLVLDCFAYILTGQFNLTTGIFPMGSKVLALGVLGLLAWIVNAKFDVPLIEEVKALKPVRKQTTATREVKEVPSVQDDLVVEEVEESAESELEVLASGKAEEVISLSTVEEQAGGLESEKLEHVAPGEEETLDVLDVQNIFNIGEMNEITADYLASVLSEGTSFGQRSSKDLIFDLGAEQTKAIMEMDKSLEGLVG